MFKYIRLQDLYYKKFKFTLALEINALTVNILLRIER